MKIAIFTDTYFPQLNGVPISIDNFTRVLRRKGHKVYIYAPKIKNFKDSDEDVNRLSSVKIISSEPEVRVPIPMPNKIYRQMLLKDFDLVHARLKTRVSQLKKLTKMNRKTPLAAVRCAAAFMPPFADGTKPPFAEK